MYVDGNVTVGILNDECSLGCIFVLNYEIIFISASGLSTEVKKTVRLTR